jgi:hypothetical protein
VLPTPRPRFHSPYSSSLPRGVLAGAVYPAAVRGPDCARTDIFECHLLAVRDGRGAGQVPGTRSAGFAPRRLVCSPPTRAQGSRPSPAPAERSTASARPRSAGRGPPGSPPFLSFFLCGGPAAYEKRYTRPGEPRQNTGRRCTWSGTAPVRHEGRKTPPGLTARQTTSSPRGAGTGRCARQGGRRRRAPRHQGSWHQLPGPETASKRNGLLKPLPRPARPRRRRAGRVRSCLPPTRPAPRDGSSPGTTSATSPAPTAAARTSSATSATSSRVRGLPLPSRRRGARSRVAPRPRRLGKARSSFCATCSWASRLGYQPFAPPAHREPRGAKLEARCWAPPSHPLYSAVLARPAACPVFRLFGPAPDNTLLKCAPHLAQRSGALSQKGDCVKHRLVNDPTFFPQSPQSSWYQTAQVSASPPPRPSFRKTTDQLRCLASVVVAGPG